MNDVIRIPYDGDFPDSHYEVAVDQIITDPTYADVQRIVQDKQYACFRWSSDRPQDQPLMVDMQTANMLVTIHDALKEPRHIQTNEAWVHESRLSFAKLVTVGWQLINGRNSK